MNLYGKASHVSLDILNLSNHVSRFAHNWNGTGDSTSCRLCGKRQRDALGGCMIAAAIHRNQAPERIRATLERVRPNHPAGDLLSLSFEKYMAARWQRNVLAIEMLGLDLDREYRENTRLIWAEEYWRHQAEILNGALSGLHDLFSEAIESGRVSFQDAAERVKVLEAFAQSNVAANKN